MSSLFKKHKIELPKRNKIWLIMMNQLSHNKKINQKQQLQKGKKRKRANEFVLVSIWNMLLVALEYLNK